MATIMFGSARIDENGNASGGSAGDQTGKEVCTQSFYMHSKGWYGYRAKSVTIANALATAMQQACDNNNIGYDQNQRGTLLTQFKSTKSIKSITTKCECDCSSLVRVCIYQAADKLLSDFTTSDEPTVLANSGLFDKVTVNSSADVYNGDILVTKTKGHTGIIVSGRARSSSSSSSGSGTTSSGTTSSTSGTKYTATLTVDGQWGKCTTKRLQTVLGTTIDGTVSHQYSSYKSSNPGCLSETFQWESKPSGYSPLIKAIQKKVGATQDGYIGPKTIKAMQKYYGTTQDGCISKVSDVVKAMQKALNNGKF